MSMQLLLGSKSFPWFCWHSLKDCCPGTRPPGLNAVPSQLEISPMTVVSATGLMIRVLFWEEHTVHPGAYSRCADTAAVTAKIKVKETSSS